MLFAWKIIKEKGGYMDKNIHKNHRKRLRERFEREGADSFELHELLELFLFDAIPRVNTNPIAHRLLDRFGDLDGVFSASKEELMSVKGIGERAAEYIINASEEQRRQIDEEIAKRPISSFSRAANYFISKMRRVDDPAHRVIILCLDEKYVLIECREYDNKRVLFMIDDCIETGALKAIVGCAKGCGAEIKKNADLFERFGIELCDIIEVDGFDADSIMDE